MLKKFFFGLITVFSISSSAVEQPKILQFISWKTYIECCPGPACINDEFKENLFVEHIERISKNKKIDSCAELKAEAEIIEQGLL